MKLVYDEKLMKYIILFENFTKVKVKDAYLREEGIWFVIKEGGLFKAVGKSGIKVKKLESMVKKKIKVIENCKLISEWNEKKPDGSKVFPDDVLVEFTGNYRALLTGERKALNFLQRLSGIATYANLCMQELEGLDVEILDTRKTLPGYRHLDKYAVRMGGASNHRFGLYDMVMIKDNHIQVAGGIEPAVKAIRTKIPKSIKIEVETSNLDEVQQAIDAGVDIIMLDNMSSAMMIEAVALINKRAKIEASGNMTLKRIRKVASTGVDYISIGALTHSVKALDISQRIID